MAVNLAVAFSALGYAVELSDRDPDAPLGRALTGSSDPQVPSTLRLEPGAGLGLSARAPAPGDDAADVRLVDAGGGVSHGGTELPEGVALVVVPLDASPESRSSLDSVVAALGGRRDLLMILLSRLLPRAADRWSLVDALDDEYADALSPVTVPMGRPRGASPGASGAGEATLYAPTGRAAKAYRAVARDLVARLGLAPERRSE